LNDGLGSEPRRLNAAIRDILKSRRRLSPLADEIGAMIVSGELGEGTVLSERMFGVRRAVSRTSFREAVKVLEGLIRSRQNTGTLVAPRGNWHLLDPDLLGWRLNAGGIETFIEDFFTFRQSVEPLAAESAARRANEPSIGRIREALNAMQVLEGRDPFGPEYVAADVQFHQAIFEASANEFLVAMGHILEVPLTVSFTLHSSLHVGPANRLALHATILDAIVAGDAPGAKAASAALLLDVADHVRHIVAEAERM
jgi:DNA-binding FadR family transcriptional regulator